MMEHKRERLTVDEFDMVIEKLGVEGWELVTVIDSKEIKTTYATANSDYGFSLPLFDYYFRRNTITIQK